MAKKKQSERLSISFKQTNKDIEIYLFLKKKADEEGISEYVKRLVWEDMKKESEK